MKINYVRKTIEREDAMSEYRRNVGKILAGITPGYYYDHTSRIEAQERDGSLIPLGDGRYMAATVAE